MFVCVQGRGRERVNELRVREKRSDKGKLWESGREDKGENESMFEISCE